VGPAEVGVNACFRYGVGVGMCILLPSYLRQGGEAKDYKKERKKERLID